MLIDSAEITVRSGRGGDGVVSWRREKFVPKGGPDGGDGGRGGSIIFRATHNLDTLSSFRYRKVFQAENGHNGAGKKKTGRAGEDLELLIPVGTIITDIKTGKILADMAVSDQVALIAKGGKGGLGNVHFATATHQQPTEFTSGEKGQSISVKLELQLIADVALVGLPNAGKSSLINALTNAGSRIGAYAFSTTEPVLGVLRQGEQSVTLVDLPGLIKGAHQGKGLGDQFLKHTKRVKALVKVIDATQPEPEQVMILLDEELKSFEPSLSTKPTLLAINKIDLLSKKELVTLKQQFPSALWVSAVTSAGLKELQAAILDVAS